MLYTKQTVRDNIRNRDGERVFYLGKQDQLTSDAKDWLTGERIRVLPAEQAKKERWQLLSGGFAEEKPEHMTHLNGQLLVPKTHPRIRFRGAMDTLESQLLLSICQTEASCRRQLEQVLQFTRLLLRCEVLEEPVGEQTLCGMTARQLRERSHRPQDFYGQPHFMPEAADSYPLLLVNRCRCEARAAELAAVEAFTDRDGNPTRQDLLQAMNRISSMLYLIMIQLKGKME